MTSGRRCPECGLSGHRRPDVIRECKRQYGAARQHRCGRQRHQCPKSGQAGRAERAHASGVRDHFLGLGQRQRASGDTTLVTSGAITAGSTGIYASNAAIGSQTTPLGSSATPIKVTVVANGAITSGPYLPNGGNAPGGVIANFDPGNINGYNSFVIG